MSHLEKRVNCSVYEKVMSSFIAFNKKAVRKILAAFFQFYLDFVAFFTVFLVKM